jgi:hypothetical protein
MGLYERGERQREDGPAANGWVWEISAAIFICSRQSQSPSYHLRPLTRRVLLTVCIFFSEISVSDYRFVNFVTTSEMAQRRVSHVFSLSEFRRPPVNVTCNFNEGMKVPSVTGAIFPGVFAVFVADGDGDKKTFHFDDFAPVCVSPDGRMWDLSGQHLRCRHCNRIVVSSEDYSCECCFHKTREELDKLVAECDKAFVLWSVVRMKISVWGHPSAKWKNLLDHCAYFDSGTNERFRIASKVVFEKAEKIWSPRFRLRDLITRMPIELQFIENVVSRLNDRLNAARFERSISATMRDVQYFVRANKR